MTSVPLVSIVVPYHNSNAFFKDLLSSVSSQSIKEIEVIVVDDCSSELQRNLLLDSVKQFSKGLA